MTLITEHDVLTYIPNLIGYARVGLTLSSFVIMLCCSFSSLSSQQQQEPQQQPQNNYSSYWWILALLLYLLGFAGDLIDGWVARKLKQTSDLGGVLDMVTDRCSTLGLLYILGQEYSTPTASDGRSDESLQFLFLSLRITFVMLQILDISSHWCQMYAALSVAGAHHKSEDGNKDNHFLVRWFYKYYWFFGYLCVGAEFTYMLLYARQQVPVKSVAQKVIDAALCITVPGCLAKQAVNLMQLTSACRKIARQDAAKTNNNNNATPKQE